MIHYIIDGNNLIHKIKSFDKLLTKDKQQPRYKLVFMIENYFHNKKVKLSIHFDGFEADQIRTSFAKIIYSNKKTADDNIRIEIGSVKSRGNMVVVTSDDAIKNFARKCGCRVISSEEFIVQLQTKRNIDEEKEKINSINNVEYFKKLFNAK